MRDTRHRLLAAALVVALTPDPLEGLLGRPLNVVYADEAHP